VTRQLEHTRRDFLALLTALGAAGLGAPRAFAQQSMPLRRIPSTGEELPVIGLGSSKAVSEIAAEGAEHLAAVLRALVEHGGKVVDTWPRDPDNDSGFGRVINEPDLRDALFVTTKVDQVGRQAGIDQFDQSLRNYGRETIDLAQVFSLTDLETHWPSLKEWKAAGRARYIGVTVSQYELYDQLEAFLSRETPDFFQVNYSITERLAEERMLPIARDRGLAVIINRPFMNGAYFRRLAEVPLPEWTAEFDCHSWAQFSLKYILANPVLTCVLTETSNPVHMAENAMAAYGRMPDEPMRHRMAEYIDQL
jgi:diketogulonate reductase-like aldo/keto reductase